MFNTKMNYKTKTILKYFKEKKNSQGDRDISFYETLIFKMTSLSKEILFYLAGGTGYHCDTLYVIHV